MAVRLYLKFLKTVCCIYWLGAAVDVNQLLDFRCTFSSVYYASLDINAIYLFVLSESEFRSFVLAGRSFV